MAYMTQNFQPLNLAQISPLGYGLQQGAQGFGEGVDIYKNIIAAQLDNYKKQQEAARAPYYGQLAQAELAKAQAEPNEINARTGLIGQQANQLSTMTPLEAQKLKLYNQFYPQQIQAEIENNKALADWRKSGGFGNSRLGGVSGQTLNILQRQIQTENPNFSAEQLNDATNAYIEGRNTLNDGTKLRPPSGIVATQLDNITKQRYTTSQLNQNRYASTLDTLLDASEQLMPSVSKYSSGLGSAKGSLDKISGFLGGQGSPEYQDYIHFTRDIVPSMAGEFLRVLGANATNEQKNMMLKMADPTAFDVSPKTALDNFKYLSNLYKNKISPSIRKSTHEYMLPSNKISDNLKRGSEANPIPLVIKNGKLVEE